MRKGRDTDRQTDRRREMERQREKWWGEENIINRELS